MRITGIEIANYRGFAGDSFRLTLEQGENLLVYGENGAGKSSLYNSLKDFLHAATSGNLNIEQRRNRDNPDGPPSMRIATTANPAASVEWSAAARGQDANEWRTLDDGKGFLDYRALLRFYNATQTRGRIDLFPLLVEGMLANHRMEVPGNPTFLKEWRGIELQPKYRLREYEKDRLKTRVKRFNAAFQIAANALAARATEHLREFDPEMGVAFVCEQDASFAWPPKSLTAPRFVAEVPRAGRASISDYHEVFNEARLSAMAICLFFAALESCPIPGPRLLVLDDVLIGLDMGNRRKVVDLVQKLFPDWQIIILTYHKAWFEVLKARVKVGKWGGHEWRSVVLRPEKCATTGLLAIAHDECGTALETAGLCLERRDYKAAAVYARTALEALLHKHAERLHLPVVFKKDHHKHNTEHFLQPIERRLDHLGDSLKKEEGKGLLAELRFARRTVLNAFAHADEIGEDQIAGEVDHGIAVVRRFETFLTSLSSLEFVKDVSESKPAVPQLLMQARQHAADGDHVAAARSLREATELFVNEYAESTGLAIPFKRSPSFAELFRAVFPEDAMDAAELAAFRPLLPYFFGNYKPAVFNQARFDAAIRLILHLGYGKLLHILAGRLPRLSPQPPAPPP